ncbi:MAG: amidohydrolase family protein [Planctomycetes bacterium]|nr:amidohydrolase family protein [Planctomycetota bacterium]
MPLPRWFVAAAFAGLAAVPALAQADAAVPSRDFAVRCGTLLLGDGKEPLRDAWLVVKGGKVHSIGQTAPAAELPVVDAQGRVVMPGIVATDGDFAPADDAEYQVTPDALAVDAFDFEQKQLAALQGGVTTAYVSPGRNRLVSGQGAVVKLAGRDLVERVLTENACLRVNFGDGAMQAPRVFEPVPHPTDDDPLLPSRIQVPTARIALLAELRALFAAATDTEAAPGGEGPAEHRYDERPLAAVVARQLPLRVATPTGRDLRAALELQRELGVRMLVEDPRELDGLIDRLVAQDVAAVFRVPVRFGTALPGGEDRRVRTRDEHPEAPARAAAAGVRLGLATADGVSPRDYLMAVAVAVGHGLPRERALRAIGADAAAILGVDARVGQLQPGKDADFLVLSGDPLAVGTMVEQTWIDGRREFLRKTSSRTLAVRAGRVLDGTGRVFRDGVVLIQDGRIKAVGEQLAVPYGAEVLDVPGGVMTPGFVDAFSHLGLAGNGSNVPNGAAGQRLHEAIEHDDPMFAPAVAAGLTTLLVAGKDAGQGGGRVTAVKTGAADRQGMVLREIAGLRLAHEAIGPDAIKPLADQLERGKRYVEEWRKYEAALAEWQRGGQQAAAAPPPEPTPAKDAAAAEDPVTGVWEADIDLQGRLQIHVVLELKLDGAAVTGSIRMSIGDREIPAQEITQGTWADGKLKLEFRGMGGTAVLDATLQGDTLTGKLTLGRMGEQDVNGRRTSKTAPTGTARRGGAAKAEPTGKPKAPKTDENLEPLRAVLEKRAALVVRSNRSAAIGDVVELLEKEQVPFLLTGVADLQDDASAVRGRKPVILLGPEVLTEERGETTNIAAVFTDRDLPIAFGSGECAGARFLPLHVAYAVRYGLSPADALAALTLWPARAFGLQDRIGSLEKGKDADLVVFAGDPFEPQSRVLLVVCNGRVVADHRESH